MFPEVNFAFVEVCMVALLEQPRSNRALLVLVAMFFHSAAEGIALGVSFDDRCASHFGIYVALILAVYNVPEG